MPKKILLTRDNYFSPLMQKRYMGVSQFKDFEKCPASALAEIKGKFIKEKTPALLMGSYMDAYFEGTLDKFKADNPEIFKRDGTLKAEYVGVDNIIERIKKDKLFMKYAGGGQQQVIMTGVIEGVQVKIMIDSLLPNAIVDRKLMKDFEPIYLKEQGRLPWFEAWRYDLQGAVYQEIVYQNTGKKLPFILAAATKEKVTDYDLFEIEQDLLDFELGKFKENVPIYDAMKKGIIVADRCDECDYCRSTKKLASIKKSSQFIYE